MKHLIFSLLVIAYVSTFSQNQKINQIDSLGLKQGFWKEYKIFPSKIMKNEVNHYDIVKNHMLFKQSGYYVNGLRNGIWYEYWPNDNIRNEANYVKGIILGDFKAFYPNGNLMMKGNICLSKKILVAGFNEQGEFVGEELTDTKIILEYFYLK